MANSRDYKQSKQNKLAQYDEKPWMATKSQMSTNAMLQDLCTSDVYIGHHSFGNNWKLKIDNIAKMGDYHMETYTLVSSY
jgi:hypothetical protein|tara:strand:- start:737 stop:976 length:240 start_codon:yes stop_codon:yes gene_type:complete